MLPGRGPAALAGSRGHVRPRSPGRGNGTHVSACWFGPSEHGDPRRPNGDAAAQPLMGGSPPLTDGGLASLDIVSLSGDGGGAEFVARQVHSRTKGGAGWPSCERGKAPPPWS